MILITFMISGCATHKNVTKYITKNPEILTDFVDTTRRIEYVPMKVLIDTVIYDTIPGDTVYADTTIKRSVGLLSGSVSVETDLSSARAWISKGRLHIELVQNKQVLQFKIDSAVALVPRETRTQWLPSEPYIPKSFGFYKNGFFITAGLLLLLLVFLVLKR